MNKEQYTNSKTIIDFIEWVKPRISGEIEFKHSYTSNKTKLYWSCNSIYNAYENYSWPFTCILPNGKKIKGKSFGQSEVLLENIEFGMKSAIMNKNAKDLLLYSRSMLDWGGVLRSNYNKLEDMGDRIIQFYELASRKLDPESVNTRDSFEGIIMNSGFTKLYSLIIDDFVIYDSRVGAALGLLVRYYLEDRDIGVIPEELNFSYGNSRPTKSDVGPINKRNPSSRRYKFTQLANNGKKHIKNNIYANWLLGEIAKESEFSSEKNPIRALEASLFMIGYQVNTGEKLPE
ncbi:hypothetical protein SAMN02745751_03136 [Dethiosulfatibacter aminovorans DSM 17477]|uniref:Uncharacterized protein n=1 Tax=Dethiosulfatibacter aminovorans DSM 17477 TaxID=1121476 RepID=A0A1M6LC92_9FIRM|nr:hypothetical protein [Dethiosulfatibacter aminovorans]SHJ68788.1 hypothetical protein SAMN02745751_03136 [Dethiosulfatibacter aminovorans DSM 17477]